ncbi:MAG: hypothetical protein US36_C0001G0016 [Candidatus Wolfebacteria bacterium GW2011_GWC1_37_10]|uniref:Uncharacterized protein n=2 Tax=Candidatus Wolfeibacteriota TaxID=1752735 RepID=A0A0G0G029_9BACT|nr:MAG: hypothetical protein US36_C0001G0016 [Candidatus Wolfebacteria bacterium GW2011_GWC1_37_10]
MEKSQKKFIVRIFLELWVLFFLFMLAIAALSCSSISTAPTSEKEAFPIRPDDPTLGLVIKQGTAHANLYITDQAGRLIRSIYTEGADRVFEVNGRPLPKILIHRLPVGSYRVDIYPFYYRFVLIRFWRYRVDLPKQSANITVDQRVNSYYKGRYVGWILEFNAGNIPPTTNGFPGIGINLQGPLWKSLLGGN